VKKLVEGMVMKKKVFPWFVSIFLGIFLSGCSCTMDKKEITTDSGLKYVVLQEGESEQQVKVSDKVTVHYTGWLQENGKPGKKFDSSIDRGSPFNFTIGVGQVIKGWDEGALSMKVGEKRRLIIPASLGYGANGVPGLIPAGSTLIFEVELLKIN